MTIGTIERLAEDRSMWKLFMKDIMAAYLWTYIDEETDQRRIFYIIEFNYL